MKKILVQEDKLPERVIVKRNSSFRVKSHQKVLWKLKLLLKTGILNDFNTKYSFKIPA